MTEHDDRSAFLTALVTEQFVLQSAASATVSEAVGRASVYLSSLSSMLVAMGFAVSRPRVLVPLTAVALPTVVLLGAFTVARLVDTGVQNVAYLAGIARIRAYYRTLTPDGAGYFAPWGGLDGDDVGQALAALSRRRGWLTGLGTAASMVAAVNSVVAGTGIALAIVAAAGGRDQVVPATLAGLTGAAALYAAFLRYQDRRYRSLDPSS
jgi:hypothetical protein